ncbi:MAG: hypothetical protein AA931_11915 [Peptococcaceae bacterium 1109]|nr:MAG: hypothetical protein AA931_11915 [Peptococcaceae bacterium 1109]
MDLIHHQQAPVQTRGAQVSMACLHNGEQCLVNSANRDRGRQETLRTLCRPVSVKTPRSIVILPEICVLRTGQNALGVNAVYLCVSRYRQKDSWPLALMGKPVGDV